VLQTVSICWTSQSNKVAQNALRGKNLAFETVAGQSYYFHSARLYNDPAYSRIFVPSGKNTLVDILLARSVTGESPTKKRQVKKYLAGVGSPIRHNGKGSKRGGRKKKDDTSQHPQGTHHEALANSNQAHRKPPSRSRKDPSQGDVHDDGLQPIAGSCSRVDASNGMKR